MRKQHRTGKHYSIHAPRSAKQGHLYPTPHRKCHKYVSNTGSHAATEIKDQKSLRTPTGLQQHPQKVQTYHVKEQVKQPTVKKLKGDIPPGLPPVGWNDSAPREQTTSDIRKHLEEKHRDIDNQQILDRPSRTWHSAGKPAGTSRRGRIIILLRVWSITPTHQILSFSRHIAHAEMLLASCNSPLRIISSIRPGLTSSTSIRSYSSSIWGPTVNSVAAKT